PMLPLRLFKSRTFSAANATSFCMTAGLTASAFLTFEYFQLGLGYSPLESGLRLLPWTATVLVVAPCAGALSDRLGRRRLMVVGLAVNALGLAWYATLAGPDLPYFPSILILLLAGIGLAMALPVTPTAIVSAVAMPDIGKASGVNST